MIKRVTIGDLRLTLTAARVSKVVGVNSQLEDGQHILMWDFDNTSLNKVIYSLTEIGRAYRLPGIHILESKTGTNFMAYCFKRVSFINAIRVIANTDGIDFNFLKYGIYRGRFTLRVSPKNERYIKHVFTTMGYFPEDVKIDDLKSWVKYETLRGK